ncbi:MAG: hypothetical protein FIA92_05905 [Chloroflexi bacterium]|nr:hypothetical protein [Chloroflexota bacterium]
MTQRTDIERVLDLWLADGPNHVPDRVFDDAVAAVYRAPQRSPWRLRWRDLKVSTRFLAAAIAVLAIVAVGVGLTALGPTSNTGASPSPSMAPTPTPTQAAVTDDPSLCQPSDPECTGRLAAGTHSTAAVLAPVRYTVPEGWQKPLDVPGAMNLEADGAPANTIIAVWPDWNIMSQSTCENRPEEGRGRSVEDLLAFLIDHPGLVVSTPERVVLGGLPGVVVDVRRDETWSGPCTNAVNLFTHQGTINDIGWQDISGDRVNRLWLLDGPNGHVTNVAIEAPNSDAFDAFVEIATPVIESFRFQREALCVDTSECTGPLLAGLHHAGPPLEQPFTYVVPDGWVNDWNVPLGYALVPAGATETSEPGIFIFLDVYGSDQTSCTRRPAGGLGRTSADLVAWLGALPDLSITAPEPVVLGGLTGSRVDVSVTSGGPVCSGDYQLWVSDYQPLWWGLTPGHPTRHYLLDLPDRHNVLIVVPAPEADFDALMAIADPIIESFDFTP